MGLFGIAYLPIISCLRPLRSPLRTLTLTEGWLLLTPITLIHVITSAILVAAIIVMHVV
jgi:hypothetical protein